MKPAEKTSLFTRTSDTDESTLPTAKAAAVVDIAANARERSAPTWIETEVDQLAFAGACISASAWILVALGSPTMLRALLLLALCSLAQCYVVGTAPTALRPLARAPAAVTMEEQPPPVFSKDSSACTLRHLRRRGDGAPGPRANR